MWGWLAEKHKAKAKGFVSGATDGAGDWLEGLAQELGTTTTDSVPVSAAAATASASSNSTSTTTQPERGHALELQRRMLNASDAKVDPKDRVLVEWMCGEHSNLSRMSEERGVRSVRVSEKSCDVDSMVGYLMARNVVMFFITAGKMIDLMGSLPCKSW